MKFAQRFLFLLLLFGSHMTLGQSWELVQSVEVSDPEPLDNFGFSVAIHEDILISGAWAEDHDPANEVSEAGATYLFKKQADGSWLETQKWNSPNPESLGYFGSAVATNGEIVAVGAYNEDYPASNFLNTGTVYLYDLDGDPTDTLLSILDPNPQNANYFGFSLAMFDTYLLVGACNDDEDDLGQNVIEDAGAAYLFQILPDQSIQLVQKFVASDRAEDDEFGRHLDMTEDRIIISAPNKNHDPTFQFQVGAAYIFERQGD
ncbi:MAG: hypothetical protein AAFU64_18685, partial [Bacteroidota bacterium]